MSTFLTVLVVIAIIAVIVLFLLYHFGQKMQVRQAESQKTLDAFAQKVSMLIIDKKKMKLKEAPFPSQVYEQTPFYLKLSSVYVVRAKVSNRVMDFMCDKPIFEQLAPKSTVVATVSGAYITQIHKGAVLSDKEMERRHKQKTKAAKKAEKEAKKEAKKAGK